MILKTLGNTVDEPILELTEDRLLLLDRDGKENMTGGECGDGWSRGALARVLTGCITGLFHAWALWFPSKRCRTAVSRRY